MIGVMVQLLPLKKGDWDDCMDTGGRVTQDAVTEGFAIGVLNPPNPLFQRGNNIKSIKPDLSRHQMLQARQQ